MNKLWKTLSGTATDTLRRAVGRDQLGMLLFKLPQLLDQLVVFTIRNFRIVLDVVEILVPANFFTKVFDRLFDGPFFGQAGFRVRNSDQLRYSR